MRNDKQNIIVDKTIHFSLAVVTYCEYLEKKLRDDLDEIIKILSKKIATSKEKTLIL